MPSVTVYDRDFDPNKTATLAPGVTATWSQTNKPTSPSGQTFLGEFGNQSVTLTLNNLPSHGQLTVDFDLYLLRSWDGNDPTWGGPNGDR